MTTLLARSCVPVLILVSLCWSGTVAAQSAEPGRMFRVAGTLGVDSWSDLGDLEPILGGSFDDAGFGGDLAFHLKVGRLGPADVLVGGNLGGFFHGSSVTGLDEGEDLQASLVYLTPSVKFAFGRPGERRFYLDVGVGYYGAAIDEQESDCFFSCDTYEYYDDDGFGGYAGVSADFPIGSRSVGLSLTTAVQVHFINFDDPVELDDTGSLGGPIYAFEVGVAWGR